MPITLPLARTLVFQHLLALVNHPQPASVGLMALDAAVRDLAAAQGTAAEWNGAANHLNGLDSVNVRVAVQELVAAGVLVRGLSAFQSNGSWLQVTEFGLSCLQAGAINPYDPDGYLASIAAQAPNLDPVARRYLEEGLECLTRRCDKAAAVMLGGASETVMLALIDAFHAALLNPVEKQQFENGAIKPLSIKQRSDHFRQRLAAVQGQHVPPDLRQDLDLKLDGIFALLRAGRNDAGHPNLNAITHEAVHGNYLLFPSYCGRAYALIGHFANHPIP